MTDPDAQTVASSATDTPDAIPSMADYAAMRQAERLGTVREPSIPASAAGQPAEPAGETAPLPEAASEPAKPSGHKGNAETRKAELESEIQALLKQRAELRREVTPAEPVAASAPPASQPAPMKVEGEPQYADFEADPARYPDPYAAWMDARFEWRAKQAEERAAKAVEERLRREQSDRELKQRTSTLQQRIDAAIEADPSLRERILPNQFDAVPTSLLNGEPAAPQNDLAEAMLDAEKPADLMAYLSEQPKALARLLTSPNPRAFWRTLGQIEGQMALPPKRTPKTITDAPEPPHPVGTRLSALSDADAALRGGDLSAYEAARNRERLAGMR